MSENNKIDRTDNCKECGGTGRYFNHDMGEVECSECEGSGEVIITEVTK